MRTVKSVRTATAAKTADLPAVAGRPRARRRFGRGAGAALAVALAGGLTAACAQTATSPGTVVGNAQSAGSGTSAGGPVAPGLPQGGPGSPAGGSAGSASSGAVPPGNVATPGSRPPSTVPSGAVMVTTAQNGATVHVHVGGVVALVDFPSNWFPQSSDPSVLSNPPVLPGRMLCKNLTEVGNPPGVPCLQIPLDYTAKKAGTTTLTAHRTQCGEARRCVPPESYDFVLTVVVN